MTDKLVEQALPLLNCGHHANRPNPRQAGERIVGFVIGEDDIGLGLSEPLFALDAVVKLAQEAIAARTSPDKDRIEALEGALRKAKPLIIAHMNSVHKTSDYLAVRGFLDEIDATLTPTAGGER